MPQQITAPADHMPPAGARRWARPAASAALALALVGGTAQAATLYDASLGTAPTAQGWLALSLGGTVSAATASGVHSLDTASGTAPQFGYSPLFGPLLDTDAGFQLSLRLQVLAETHSSPNRAGYSLVMVGSDPSRALELSFWTDRVWAQGVSATDPDRLVHAEEAVFNTSTGLVDYLLTVQGAQYSLSADGAPLLSGALRDYRSEGFPYTVPNFLFLGDNSSRGTAVTALARVGIEPLPAAAAPVPEPASLLLAGLAVAAVLAASAHGRRASLLRKASGLGDAHVHAHALLRA